MIPSEEKSLSARAAEVCRLVAERLAALSPSQRDGLLQLYIAQGMSPAQRFRNALNLIKFTRNLRAAQGESAHG